MLNLLLEIEGIDWIYALMGIVIVFLVLLVLVLYVRLQKLFTAGKKATKKDKASIDAPVALPVGATATPIVNETDDGELVAAITAAIMMYYDTHSSGTQTSTGFVVKRISRI